MTVIVSSSVITDIDDAISVRFGVRGLLEDTLEFKVAGADPSFIADTLEAALLGLLVPAMAAGEDMRLDGPVSEELLFRITNYVVPLLYLCIPGTQPIAIHAEDRRKISLKGEPAVLTGLSNGIDSSNVFAAHLSNTVPSDMRVTHFLFHDVGSGNPKNKKTSPLAQARLKRMQTSAQAMRRPLISVKSNLARFYKHKYQQTHTMRSAAVAFALGGRTRRYLYASSYSYSVISSKRTGDIATADPILLPLLKSETIECFSAGAAQTRVEKTAVVSENELARKSLDVCINQWPNCSWCWKCARTLLTLELFGKAEAFSSVFDLSTFCKVRDRYIAHVLVTSRHNAFAGELRALMRAIGFRPSLRHWLKAALIYPLFLTSIVPRFGNGIRRLYRRVSDFPPDH